MAATAQTKTFEQYLQDVTDAKPDGIYTCNRWTKALENLTSDYLKNVSGDYIFDLLQKIEILQEGEGTVLEYGVENKPGGMFSAVRIRWMKTAGGNQYGIHVLNHLGQQGSGEYVQDKEYALSAALKQEAYYNRLTFIGEKMKSAGLEFRKEKLVWFLFKEGEQRVIPNASVRELGKVFGQDTETVNLTLSDNH
jgi:hypothetical protein